MKDVLAAGMQVGKDGKARWGRLVHELESGRGLRQYPRKVCSNAEGTGTHVGNGKQREARKQAEPEEDVACEGVVLDRRQPADHGQRDLGHLKDKEVAPGDGQSKRDRSRSGAVSGTSRCGDRGPSGSLTHRSFLVTTSMTSSWQQAESRKVRKVARLRLILPVESL